MGAIYQGECFATADAAAARFCSASFPQSRIDQAGSVSMLSCSVVDAGHVSIASSVEGVAAVALPVSFAECDPAERYTDMSLVWGLILGAAAIVWAVKSFVLKLVSNQ
jgi:hypothetical protein